MIRATIKTFDALVGFGWAVTDDGTDIPLHHSQILGTSGGTLPSERDWLWLDRITGLRCQIDHAGMCYIKNAPRAA